MLGHKHNSHDNQEGDDAYQKEKIKEMRIAIGPVRGRSLKYCSDACLKRYLEARNWNLGKSKKMLEETLNWRSEYKPEEIVWHEVAIESETGKLYRANFRDRVGRTVIIMRPEKQNTCSHDDQIKHLVYVLENAIINLPDEQEQMMWLIDFTGWSMSNASPMKTARETAHILQAHYPERLAVGFLYNPPRIFEVFWKAIKYFLDPKTFQKVKFVYPKKKDSMELMFKFFDADVLPVEFGGKNKAEYNHEEFSKMMQEDDIKTAKFWAVEENNFNLLNH